MGVSARYGQNRLNHMTGQDCILSSVAEGIDGQVETIQYIGIRITNKVVIPSANSLSS